MKACIGLIISALICTQTQARDQLKAVSKKKIVKPEMKLLTPIQRRNPDDFKYSALGVQPCGGVSNGSVHYQTSPGSRNIIGWKIEHRSLQGNCTIRVGDSPIQSKLQIMFPLDGTADERGVFPCGRSDSDFEGKEVRMPQGLSCDRCILQVEWNTEVGKQHRCADLQVTDTEIPECAGQCLNEGICNNGVCNCQDGFSGSNCQYETSFVKPTNYWPFVKYFLLIVAVIGLIIGLFIGGSRLLTWSQALMEDRRRIRQEQADAAALVQQINTNVQDPDPLTAQNDGGVPNDGTFKRQLNQAYDYDNGEDAARKKAEQKRIVNQPYSYS